MKSNEQHFPVLLFISFFAVHSCSVYGELKYWSTFPVSAQGGATFVPVDVSFSAVNKQIPFEIWTFFFFFEDC